MSIKITAELVKELRDATSVSVMQCKNALEEAEGDMEKALIILKKKSSSIAMKKADRNASDGVVVALEGAGKVLLLTLHSETDFVARNNDFITLANELAKIALNEGIDTMQTKSLDIINPVVQKVGEKIELGKVELIEGSVLGAYVHGSKSAVVVSLGGGSKELAKDIAMHIAAMKPAFIKGDDVTAEDKAKVIEVFEKEVAESDKPEEIKKKMLEGKISTYFKEQTLMDQMFIKNPDITVGNLLKEKGATLISFIRESIG
ncbi:MAG: translation elongation factor Ts [Candidatus Nomurabacteria bacterium]|nr:translation elongation factor Ts [Candidatus Nomurabacteria bacterium]